MRISSGRVEESNGWVRLTTTAHYERRGAELYFEVPHGNGQLLSPSIDGFIPSISALAPLLGESVLEVEEADPDLIIGVRTALEHLRLWYPQEYGRPFVISAQEASPVLSHQRPAACFLTGGIDSLATLRSNHLSHPSGHPMRIEVAILVDFYAGSHNPARQQESARLRLLADRLRDFCQKVGIKFVLARTNIGRMIGYEMWHGWGRARHGMFFGGVGHALSGGLSSVRIASSAHVKEVNRPWGSHPFIDNELWSGSFRVIHDGLLLSRTMKTELVSAWPEALPYVNVCTRPGTAETWNCGSCEKCVRTAVGFTLAGHDDASISLLGRELRKGDVAHIRTRNIRSWRDIASRASIAGPPWLAREAKSVVRASKRRKAISKAIPTEFRPALGLSTNLRFTSKLDDHG